MILASSESVFHGNFYALTNVFPVMKQVGIKTGKVIVQYYFKFCSNILTKRHFRTQSPGNTLGRGYDALEMCFNPRPAGGGGGVWTPPPSGFSRIAKKRRRAAPPGFHPPYPPSFTQLLWKFRPNSMWGQVTRSGQVTQLQNNFPIAPRLQCFRESYETFGIWWGHHCLQNVYLGFLISVT